MLTPESLARIDCEIAKYPDQHRQSAVMAALRVAQEEKSWLSTEIMDFVATYLGMPPIAVYEVASFYTMFDTEPVGRHKLTLCTNLPCLLRGAEGVGLHLRDKLGIDFGQTTADGRFTLKQGECFGTCVDAPVLIHNNKRMCSFLTPEKVDELLNGMD